MHRKVLGNYFIKKNREVKLKCKFRKNDNEQRRIASET